MKKLALALGMFLTACQTAPVLTPEPEVTPMERSDAYIQSQLGMIRAANDLGYEEQKFNPCQYGQKSDAQCSDKYMAVVHLQLLCRDTEGSTSTAPVELTPLISNRVLWKLGGVSGITRSDDSGFSQLTAVSRRSMRNARLILRIGHQFLGFTASEMTRVVLPRNFCS